MLRKAKTNEAQRRKQAESIRQRGIEQMAEHDPSATAKRQMNHKPYQAAVLIREQGEQMRRETAESWLKRKNVIERNLRLMRLGKYLSSLTKPELEELRDLLNLSDDEYPIFEELSHGRSKVYISDQCKICVSTVDNRIRAIRKKLERLQNGGVTGG